MTRWLRSLWNRSPLRVLMCGPACIALFFFLSVTSGVIITRPSSSKEEAFLFSLMLASGNEGTWKSSREGTSGRHCAFDPPLPQIAPPRLSHCCRKERKEMERCTAGFSDSKAELKQRVLIRLEKVETEMISLVHMLRIRVKDELAEWITAPSKQKKKNAGHLLLALKIEADHYFISHSPLVATINLRGPVLHVEANQSGDTLHVCNNEI